MTSNTEEKEDGSEPQQDFKKGKVYIHLFEMQPSPSREPASFAAQRSTCVELLVIALRQLVAAQLADGALHCRVTLDCGAEFFTEGAKQDIMDQFKFWAWVLQLLWRDTQCCGEGTLFTLWDKNCLTDGILQRGNPRVKLQRVVAS